MQLARTAIGLGVFSALFMLHSVKVERSPIDSVVANLDEAHMQIAYFCIKPNKNLHLSTPYVICIQHMNRARSQKKSVAMKRASTRQWVLKPQDLAVAFKLVALKGGWLPYAELGNVMQLSRFEAHAAVQRLIAAGLLAEADNQPTPIMQALRQFVIHGAQYVYPTVRGEMTVGVPTAHGALPLSEMLVTSIDPVPVWPHPKGSVKGPGVLPLYEKLPMAALEDQDLYEFLALFDALRTGQAREREMAKKILEERLEDFVDKNSAEKASKRKNDVLQIKGVTPISRSELSALIKRYHIKRLALFGSAARGELAPASDIDLLVEFEDGKAPSLGGLVALNDAFSPLFDGRKVDIATPAILNNPYRRREIEKDMQVLYAA